MPTYDFPGVYIEEQTGPGVIAGVGTSTAAFIGPAKRGPLLEPLRVSSYDEFLSVYAVLQKEGTLDPYIKAPQWFYLAHAVRGFFENGGSQAYIVRIGTAEATTWEVKNRKGPNPTDKETALQVQALDAGPDGDQITLTVEEVHLTGNLPGNAGVKVATGNSKVKAIDATKKTVEVEHGFQFRVGDEVTEDETSRAMIVEIDGNILKLTSIPGGLAVNDDLRIAHLIPAQKTIRMASTAGLFPGSIVIIAGKDEANAPAEDSALIEGVDGAGFVTFVADPARFPARTKTFNLAVPETPTLTSQEFRLKVKPPIGDEEVFENLSLERAHPRFALSTARSKLVRLLPPDVPPTAIAVPDRLVTPGPVAIFKKGKADDLTTLSLDAFKDGLAALAKVDDVNLVCIPDAAARGDSKDIQIAMIEHCLKLKDRFAILDSKPDLSPAGVEGQRKDVESERGFAALYYPWLEVRDPTSAAVPPLTMFIPPCGHIAGVFARTDQERGVHKAPANATVRGILGLERRLSDGQQGPLNLQGINVLRIFPGSNAVIVWGARTTVDKNITDWIYIPVRRLLLYIEESIEEGIRFAVFEPNNLALWQKLKRTISEFLTRVWRDGALFGDKAEQAFQVRIDEALNPPSTRALGRLYIEIQVAPVRPAEFIIVRIGLWDGGSDVSEG